MKPLRLFLYPFAWLFAVLVFVRNFLYDKGLAKVERLDRPVVSIGNLSMGGAGKSPITQDLARRLTEAGHAVAVLSRGYGREEAEQARQVHVDDSWRLSGDEPLMIARAVPKAVVCVGPSRFRAAGAASVKPDLYLVDDGFQHRALARDLDIVLIDVKQGLPRLFPVGLFRESWSALKRADLVVLTRVDSGSSCETWRRRIEQHHPGIPVLQAAFRPAYLVSPNSERLSLETLRGKRVAAFCGIAQPSKFFNVLKSLGAELVLTYPLKDHQALDSAHRKKLSELVAAVDSEMVITTAKDAVKLENQVLSDMMIFSLALEVSWDDDARLEEILEGLL